MKGRNTDGEDGAPEERHTKRADPHVSRTRERVGRRAHGDGSISIYQRFRFRVGWARAWSRRVDAMTDHETHPSTLRLNSTSTGSTVSRGSPSAVSAARKIEIFPARFFVVPLLFSRNGAREGVQVRGETRPGTRDAPSCVCVPLVSRGLPRSGARPNPRRARALRPAPSRGVPQPSRARETRNLPRVRQRVVVAGGDARASASSGSRDPPVGVADGIVLLEETRRAAFPLIRLAHACSPPPARARDPVVTLNSLTVGALPPLPQDRTFSRLSPRRPWSSAT